MIFTAESAVIALFAALTIGCSSAAPVENVPQPPVPSPPPPLADAPWSGPRLARNEVPAVYYNEWKKAENRDRCAIVVPATVPADAKPRRANFYGGWAVAYDQAGSPGSLPTGASCDSCGRGTFGIAGAGVDADGTEWQSSPFHFEWSDGSTAGYGPGYGRQWLASVNISGQRCLYQVWSYQGRGHLEELIESLRFVE